MYVEYFYSKGELKVRKLINVAATLFLITIMCLSFTSCGSNDVDKSVWENAIYTENMVFGDGTKTVLVEVKAEDRSVTFTIKTDKENLGEALLEHNLVSGEKGAYGLYVKSVNGITADYNIDNTYWAFTKNGESMLTGVDGAEISNGEHYELVYTK